LLPIWYQPNCSRFGCELKSQKIRNDHGSWLHVISCGNSALAILTTNYGNPGSQGMLYLIQDSNFVHIQPAAISTTQPAESAKPTERVKLTWKPVTTADIVKRLNPHASTQHQP
jgi:hypothetical protein